MLEPEQVDLADLALALEDHSDEHSWWLDASTGRVEPRFASALDGVGHGADDEHAALIPVEPLPADVGYGDMEDFVGYVRDARARDRLERAMVGRGAFRRFKDALREYPALRRSWFAFHDARSERRAMEWLIDHEIVERELAELALAERADPEPGDLPGLLDAHGLAHRVTRDLRRIYRARLRSVLLIGAWARGDAYPESPVELLVVLDGYASRWTEKRRMDQTMWRHSIRNDAVVTVIPITETDLRRAATPLIARAVAEGLRIQ
ncbi:MAG TPA: UPF0158 family protein [Solirubrobacteraceae bacterium]|jgi:hypothetical protein